MNDVRRGMELVLSIILSAPLKVDPFDRAVEVEQRRPVLTN